jgi:hypothetical protein
MLHKRPYSIEERGGRREARPFALIDRRHDPDAPFRQSAQ